MSPKDPLFDQMPTHHQLDGLTLVNYLIGVHSEVIGGREWLVFWQSKQKKTPLEGATADELVDFS